MFVYYNTLAFETDFATAAQHIKPQMAFLVNTTGDSMKFKIQTFEFGCKKPCIRLKKIDRKNETSCSVWVVF